MKVLSAPRVELLAGSQRKPFRTSFPPRTLVHVPSPAKKNTNTRTHTHTRHFAHLVSRSTAGGSARPSSGGSTSSNRVPRRSPFSYRSWASALAQSRLSDGHGKEEGKGEGEGGGGGSGGGCRACEDGGDDSVPAVGAKHPTNESSTMFSCHAKNATFCCLAQSYIWKAHAMCAVVAADPFDRSGGRGSRKKKREHG